MKRTPKQQAQSARALFFASVEHRGKVTARDERTLPLFPLWLILDADGTLRDDMRDIVERTQA